jgi:hypothetical protein
VTGRLGGIWLPVALLAPTDHCSAQSAALDFDFAAGTHGFVAVFADYPVSYNPASYALTGDWRPRPAEVGGEPALCISGVNHSDDLFMGWKRRIGLLLAAVGTLTNTHPQVITMSHIVCITLACCLHSLVISAAESRPNLIFILADDLAQGDRGCYGQKLIKTPHLDRMAAEGMRFNQGYCGTSVCAPSRASLMTGLRQGAIARWPGCVPAGRVCDEPWAFWDFLPTAAELAGAKVPDHCRTDGHSLVSFLKGGPAPRRDCFYWELHEGSTGAIQAVRFGNWKAVRNFTDVPTELYDLGKDSAEANNLATQHPELVAKAEALMRDARSEDPNCPLRMRTSGSGKRGKGGRKNAAKNKTSADQ